jgi:hypothetical protein
MRRAKHLLTMFGTIAVAALALGAFLASAAQAGHTWEISGALLGPGNSETCKTTSDGTITVKTEIFAMEFHLTATGFSSSGCKITQSGSGSGAIAEGTTTKYSMSGLTMDNPGGCTATSPISFAAIVSKIVTVGGVAYTTMAPESGTTLTSIPITGCAIAETYVMKGSLCAAMPQAGVFKVEQTFSFSAAADTACSTDTFTLGGHTGIARGSFIQELSGVNVGKAWGFTTT